jgi:hypothetical protein
MYPVGYTRAVVNWLIWRWPSVRVCGEGSLDILKLDFGLLAITANRRLAAPGRLARRGRLLGGRQIRLDRTSLPGFAIP